MRLDALGKLGVVLNTKGKVVTPTGTPSKESEEKKADSEESGEKRLTERKFSQNVITYGLYKAVILSHLKKDLFGENSKIKMSILLMMHILKLLNIFKREPGFKQPQSRHLLT